MIRTVTGKIKNTDLGRTLPHEHVIETAAGFNSLFPEITNREQVLEQAKKEFIHLTHPHAVVPIQYGDLTLPEGYIKNLSVFFQIPEAVAMIFFLQIAYVRIVSSHLNSKFQTFFDLCLYIKL